MSVLDCTCIFHREGVDFQGDIIHSCFQIQHFEISPSDTNTKLVKVSPGSKDTWVSNLDLGDSQDVVGMCPLLSEIPLEEPLRPALDPLDCHTSCSIVFPRTGSWKIFSSQAETVPATIFHVWVTRKWQFTSISVVVILQSLLEFHEEHVTTPYVAQQKNEGFVLKFIEWDWLLDIFWIARYLSNSVLGPVDTNINQTVMFPAYMEC